MEVLEQTEQGYLARVETIFFQVAPEVLSLIGVDDVERTIRERKPKIEMIDDSSMKGGYRFRENKLGVNGEKVECQKDLERTVTEEAIHWAHHVVNPFRDELSYLENLPRIIAKNVLAESLSNFYFFRNVLIHMAEEPYLVYGGEPINTKISRNMLDDERGKLVSLKEYDVRLKLGLVIDEEERSKHTIEYIQRLIHRISNVVVYELLVNTGLNIETFRELARLTLDDYREWFDGKSETALRIEDIVMEKGLE